MKKQGQVASFILHFNVYIFVAFVLILFFGLFKIFEPSSVSIASQSQTFQLDTEFATYLRLPITIDENEMTIADALGIVTLSTKSPGGHPYNAELLDQSKQFFNKYPNLQWKIMVEQPELKLTRDALGAVTPSISGQPTLVSTYGYSCITLPHPTHQDPIKVQLVLLNTNANAKSKDDFQTIRSMKC